MPDWLQRLLKVRIAAQPLGDAALLGFCGGEADASTALRAGGERSESHLGGVSVTMFVVADPIRSRCGNYVTTEITDLVSWRRLCGAEIFMRSELRTDRSSHRSSLRLHGLLQHGSLVAWSSGCKRVVNNSARRCE